MEQNQENIIQVPQANTDRDVESVNSQNDEENQVKGDGETDSRYFTEYMFLSMDFAKFLEKSKKKTIEESKEEDKSYRIHYLHFQLCWKVFFVLTTGIMIYLYLLNKSHSLLYLFMAYLILHVLKSFINLIWFLSTNRHDPEMNKVYYVDCLYTLGLLIRDIGFVLYFADIFTLLYIFATPNVILCLMLLCVQGDYYKIYSEFRFERFLTAIAMTLFMYKLGTSPETSGWVPFIVYFLAAMGFGLLSMLVLLGEGISNFIKAICNNHISCKSRLFELSKGLIILGLGSTIGFFIFLLVFLYVMLDKGQISNTPYTGEIDLVGFDIAAIGVMASSGFVIVLVLITKLIFNKNIIEEYRLSQKNRKPILMFVELAKKAKLLVTKQSSTYFVSNKGETDKDRPNPIEESEDCTICYSHVNEIIIRPCGHSGLCKDCAVKYLKESKICYICKEPIKNLLVFIHNRKKKCYYTKEVINIC